MTLSLSIANLTEQDREFLRNVVSLFTDPIHASAADALRKRQARIIYGPSGTALVVTTHPYLPDNSNN